MTVEYTHRPRRRVRIRRRAQADEWRGRRRKATTTACAVGVPAPERNGQVSDQPVRRRGRHRVSSRCVRLHPIQALSFGERLLPQGRRSQVRLPLNRRLHLSQQCIAENPACRLGRCRSGSRWRCSGVKWCPNKDGKKRKYVTGDGVEENKLCRLRLNDR